MDFEYILNNKIYAAAANYVSKTHSAADNDFQNAINIAATKAFVAGAKYIVDNIDNIYNIKTNFKNLINNKNE